MQEKLRCPKCNSENVIIVPLADGEEFLYCKRCKQLHVFSKIEIEKKSE